MISDNIKNLRKRNNMTQDELAAKLNVSRQSVSLWETGQTQPTIENITAMAKIFNVSADILLSDTDDSMENANFSTTKDQPDKRKKISKMILAILLVVVLIFGLSRLIKSLNQSGNSKNPSDNLTSTDKDTTFDLFTVCKNFAIDNGSLNGDYSIYQQPASKYGGYDNEYFSIAYWSDSDMVEFCLHCPLSETQSHNFYLRMRGGYDKKYEYASSKYYRDTGESICLATGYIDPSVFSANYPISCDLYTGSTDGQTEFMEETRVGICDLINLIKEFVSKEKINCDFSDFDFINF